MTKHDQPRDVAAFDGGGHHDESFDGFSRAHRRVVLQYLLAGDPPGSVTLAERAGEGRSHPRTMVGE